MDLKEEIKLYTQPDGLVSPDKNPTPDSTGNGILYTSLYYILLVRLGLSRNEDIFDFNSTIRKCERNRDTQGNVTYTYGGLFNRSQTKTQEQNGPDDYIGLCLASSIMRSYFEFDVYQYGTHNDWVFNNLEPRKFTLSAFFGRMPQFIAHVNWCAKQRPGFFLRIYWSISITISALTGLKDSTKAILGWIMVEAANDKSMLVMLASAIFTSRLNSMGGIKESLKSHLGLDHPIAKAWV